MGDAIVSCELADDDERTMNAGRRQHINTYIQLSAVAATAMSKYRRRHGVACRAVAWRAVVRCAVRRTSSDAVCGSRTCDAFSAVDLQNAVCANVAPI